MAWNKPKPDDRSDNARKLETMIENTYDNMEKAEETAELSNSKDRANIEAKNERRRESIDAMRSEMKEEQEALDNHYQ